jgi:hypothetical protein
MGRASASALTHQHDEEEGLDLIRQKERDRLRVVQRLAMKRFSPLCGAA